MRRPTEPADERRFSDRATLGRWSRFPGRRPRLAAITEPASIARHPARTIDAFEGLVQSTTKGILGGPGNHQKVELLRSLGSLEGSGGAETAKETDAAGAG